MKPQKRIDNPNLIDEALIEQELIKGKQVTIQFSVKEYSAAMLAQIDQLCCKHDDNFVIRFYGHYGQSFDCKVVESIPNVKALSIDCLVKAHNIDAITRLLHLERFAIGIFEMKETELLHAENLQKVKGLFLLETKTKAFNLEYLKNYKNLSSLIVCGHTKNINVVGTLEGLESLRLNSISKAPLAFINTLKNLNFLSVMLGGRENIHEIQVNDIEHLELVWIRGLNDLSNIGNFRKLKTLHIEDQIRLPNIQFDTPLIQLTDLKILNCKTLASVTGIENLSSLQQLRISRTNIDFDQFIKQSFPEPLKTLAFYTNKLKTDEQIEERLAKMGYVDGLDRN